MKFYFVRSLQEYNNLMTSEADKIRNHFEYIQSLTPKSEGEFFVSGYSYPAQKQVEFLCDFRYSTGFPNVNWRERLCCPHTGLNNRMRFSIHVIDSHLNLRSNSDVYIMEQVTQTFDYLRQQYPKLIGSEYLGSAVPLGAVNAQNIRNEDSTALTFADSSFDAILSYDVFEHVPNFKSVFKECFRVLKHGGRLLFSAPFATNNEKNSIRAILDETGSIQHLQQPEYHGDPIGGGNGILCYQHFGWEVLDDLKHAGFRDAFAIVGWSDEFCYFMPQLQIIALK